MSDIKQKVIDIVAESFQISPEDVTFELSVGDLPQWDSVGQLNLVATMEDKFEIDFPIEELFELTSVQAFINAIEKLL